MIAAAAERGMISPFRTEQLNPASYDLLLGDDLLIEQAGSTELVRYPLAGHSQEKPYLLVPGQFVLASTLETFALPNWVAAKFVLKSSRAREGLQHLLAGWCDPGWHGSRLTLELKNVRQLHAVALWPGMKIGQMVFLQLAAECDRSYAETGRYNGDDGVQGSKG
jgi:dCTP deaminase